MDETQHFLLKQRIDEVLYYVWDPIGVNDLGPDARDEYDSYVYDIYQMALSNKSILEISEYLTYITVDRMGLDERREHDNHIAELILDWKAYIQDSDKYFSDSNMA